MRMRKQNLSTTLFSLSHDKDHEMSNATIMMFERMKNLCLSPCTMNHADRLAHWQAVARQRARDEAKRQASPQMRFCGV